MGISTDGKANVVSHNRHITNKRELHMKYRIYFNATRRVFSVQEKTAKGWRVVGHHSNLLAKNAKTKVSEKVRQSVIAKKKKTVHAWICTDELTILAEDNDIAHSNISVKYNPYKYSNFMIDCDGVTSELDDMPHDMLLSMLTIQEGRDVPKISLLN